MIPYELLAKSGELEQKRAEVLSKLLDPDRRRPFAIITTIEGMSKELIPADVFRQGLRTLRSAMWWSRKNLRIFWSPMATKWSSKWRCRGSWLFAAASWMFTALLGIRGAYRVF